MPSAGRSQASKGDQAWLTKKYPKNPAPPDLTFVRPLYPPKAAALGKKLFVHGPDVMAYKRALARSGRYLPWNPTGWDDSYSDTFAHGTGAPDIAVSGVAGFQTHMKLECSGWIGPGTFEALRVSLVPAGLPHGGEPLFDTQCVTLLRRAAKQFADPAPGESDIVAAIAEFLEKAEANEPRWHYSQGRPIKVDVDPSAASINSDCSGIVMQAYYYAKKTTGLNVPDPAKQNWTGFGNTDLYEDDHPQVTDGQYKVGDLAHYAHHVCICRKAGDATTAVWTSHGQESGPEARQLHYRSDFRLVVRPPLLA